MPARLVAFSLTVTAATLLAGCYSYRPAAIETVPVGTTIRARVAESTGRELARLVGRSEPVSMVEGEVRDRDPDALVVWWTLGTRELGARREALGQQVRLSSDGIRTVEVRELDRARTAVVAGAAGVGLGVLVVQLFGDTGGSPDPRPPGPQEIRIPLPWR